MPGASAASAVSLVRLSRAEMLRERIAVILLLLPAALWCIAAGGWAFALLAGAGLSLAGVEYAQLYRHAEARPAPGLVAGGVLLVALGRQAAPPQVETALGALLALIAMTWHLLDYERGAAQSGTDFAVTLSGIAYLGGVGGYLISLRQLPDGAWWLLVALPSVWIADSAAYFVGTAYGRHRMAPRLSPRKTWEGFAAGVLAGGAAGAGLALVWQMAATPQGGVTPLNGLFVGLLVSCFAPLGDLGVSMIKRQAKVKDSGSLLPGHGGALDRLDSWLWAGLIGYFAVRWITG
jgi:phosphatidate cytidylyltransferase